MMEVVATNELRELCHEKLQSNHHHQQTNIHFFLQAGCPSCHPTNSVKAHTYVRTYVRKYVYATLLYVVHMYVCATLL